MKAFYLSMICILSLCCAADQEVISFASPEISTSPTPKPESVLKIQEFENGKPTITYFFDDTNKLIRSESADPSSPVIEDDGDDLIGESEKDLEFFTSELASRGIKIPFPDIIFNDVAAMTKILGVGEADERFARQLAAGIAPNGSIRLKGLNRTIRFHPFGIGIMEDEKITDYELDLKDGLPAREMFSTAGSKLNQSGPRQLIIQFDHKDGRLVRLTSNAISSVNGKEEKYTTVKTFVYSPAD